MKILLSNQFQWKLKALNVDPEKRETFPHNLFGSWVDLN